MHWLAFVVRLKISEDDETSTLIFFSFIESQINYSINAFERLW